MKKALVLLISSFLLVQLSLGQELLIVKDTLNKFQIGVPVGWRYWGPQPNGSIFQAIRPKVDANDIPRENFNINIFHHKETDIDKEYINFINSISKREGFKIIEQKEINIKNRKYKYLIETHKNVKSHEDMTDCIIFTNNNGEILQLTMATISENFDKFKVLFDKIAESLEY